MDEKFNRIPVSVIHLDKDGTVIDVEDYNLDKVEPDLWAIKGLAASLLPVIREFYTHEENVQAFEAWLKERENNSQKHSKRKCAQRLKSEFSCSPFCETRTRCKFRYTLPQNPTTTNRWKSQVKIIAFISALVYTI